MSAIVPLLPLWLLASSPVMAQPVTGYQLRISMVGGAAPVSTYDIPASAVTCGVPRPPATAAPIANPARVLWADPGNSALDCQWVDTGGGPLLALPFSPTVSYVGRLVAVSAAGASLESAPSLPFTRPGVPPATPAQLRIVPQ